MRLKWDQTGERFYETGTNKGVLYVQGEDGSYDPGVAWNGLRGVTKANDGAEPTDLFADNIKYLSLMSPENHKGTITAYTYPDEFEACDGSRAVNPGVYVGQQARVPFGLAYSTIKGNDTQGNAYGEKIHLVYNARVTPSERAYETVNEDPDAIEFSWEYSTVPVDLSDIVIDGKKLDPSAGITIDKNEVGEEAFTTLQDILYGTTDKEPRLPSLQEVIALTNPNGQGGIR